MSDPTLSPIARYSAATAPDGWLTAAGWERLADDLDAEADTMAEWMQWHRKRRDRAADCRQRAARLTRAPGMAGALGYSVAAVRGDK